VDFYDEFETQQLKEYFKENLENENEEYAAILNEYRDGLLIFDVMDKSIWQKGKTDTIAVQEYFNRTQQDYQWKQRIDADIYAATTDIFAKQIQEMLTQGKTADEVKKVLNAENKVNVILTPGVFEIDQRELPENLEITQGVSKIYPSHNSFVVVNIKEIIAPGPKSLEDVKGKVLTNYQNELETSWMQSL